MKTTLWDGLYNWPNLTPSKVFADIQVSWSLGEQSLVLFRMYKELKGRLEAIMKFGNRYLLNFLIVRIWNNFQFHLKPSFGRRLLFTKNISDLTLLWHLADIEFTFFRYIILSSCSGYIEGRGWKGDWNWQIWTDILVLHSLLRKLQYSQFILFLFSQK